MSYQIINVPIKLIKPANYNPRDINPEALKGLIESIKKFGMPQPLIINKKTNVLVSGHQRLRAAQALAFQTVPIVYVELSIPEEKALNVTLNNQKISGHFTHALGELLDEIRIELGDDFFRDIKLDEIEVPPLLEEEQEAANEKADSIPDVAQNESGVQLGDIYQLGDHRLMCGDSTDQTSIDKLMNGEKADMVFTDPPYRIDTEGGCRGKIGSFLQSQGKAIKFIAEFEPQGFLSVLPSLFNKNRMNAYIFCNKELLPDYLNWAKDKKHSFNVLVWKKPSAIPIGGSHRPDIEYLILFRTEAIWNGALEGVSYSRLIECSRENGLHPTMKPIEMLENQIYISSNRGSVVTDLFLGSGSTLIACEKTKRKCYGMELDPHYCSVIIKRWEEFSGKQAVKL